MNWTPWILLPLVGALIGYVTNTVAVTMLFRPHRPIRILGFALQGLIPKRQPDLARKIGQVVGTHLVEGSDLRHALEGVDVRPMAEKVIDKALQSKLAEFSSIPMIGAFLTPDKLSGIRDGIVDSLVSNKELIVEELGHAIEKDFDVSAVVEAKVAAFPTQQLEQIILDVAKRELVSIEIWGAVLGAIIGFLQVLLLQAMS
jgi:uncharacterized membrane protein YheB (UPF0754 family)